MPGTAMKRQDFDVRPLGRLDQDSFATLSRLIHERVGIVLNQNKLALVEARVHRRLQDLGIGEFSEYLSHLRADASGAELVRLIDVISTNVTHFFREPDHFEFLTRLARRWAKSGRRRVRLWSAACSSGEEPYSMAMTLAGPLAGREIEVRILATDISTRMLDAAERAVYDEPSLETVPPQLRRAYFRPTPDGDPQRWELTESMRRMVRFRRFNLSRTPYRSTTVFDVIVLRNVMIYFDAALRRRVVGEAYRLLRPGGFLLVGHSETLIGMDERFRMLVPSIYRKT